jgi:hypothetical protein
MIRGLLPLSPSDTMIAAAPKGISLRRIGEQNLKNSLSAMPRRGPVAGVCRIEKIFMGANLQVHACFYRCKKIKKIREFLPRLLGRVYIRRFQ